MKIGTKNHVTILSFSVIFTGLFLVCVDCTHTNVKLLYIHIIYMSDIIGAT